MSTDDIDGAIERARRALSDVDEVQGASTEVVRAVGDIEKVDETIRDLRLPEAEG